MVDRASEPPQQAGPEPRAIRYGWRYRGGRRADKAGPDGSRFGSRPVGRVGRGAALLAALLAAACHRGPDAPQVTRAWVRLAAVPGRPAAAYFTLAGAARDDRLVKVESALATHADLHGSMAAGGMTAMAPVAAVVVPANGTVRFAPGGLHVMLSGLDPAVVPGTAVPLRFGFASGRTAEAEAKTVAAGGDAPY